MKSIPLKCNVLFENTKLTLIRELPPGKRGGRSIRKVLCLCQCGVQRSFILSDIRNGGSKTCGDCSFGHISGIATRDHIDITCDICKESFSIQESRRRNLVKKGKTYKCKPCTCKLNAIILNKKGKKQAAPIMPGEIFESLKIIHEISSSSYPCGKNLRRFKVRCDCGIEKDVLLIHLKSGMIRSCGCLKDSKPERELYDFIKTILPHIEVIRNDRTLLGGLELDVYLPQYKLGIEYNGNYWHSIKFSSNPRRHFKKRQFSEAKGIRLLQFRSDEWVNKRGVVESLLKSILGISPQRFFARKLEIKKVSTKIASNFLIENHLIGSCGTAVSNVGLYTPEGVLVQLFSYQIKESNHSILECTRICSLKNHSIVGGVSKLMKYVISRNDSIQQVVSFVDLRYANGHSLVKLGFILRNTSLGWGWTDGKFWFNRRTCRANMDSRKLTQAQHAEELGLYKLWDAGQAKYVLNLK